MFSRICRLVLTVTALCFILHLMLSSKNTYSRTTEALDQPTMDQELQWQLQGPLTEASDLLLGVVRERFLQAPSSGPYRLRFDKLAKMTYRQLFPSWIMINSYIEALFVDNHRRRPRKKGFFVEAGALDGEYMSNTLRLERDYGWIGLLVEPDEGNYRQLQKTSRSAWLSPTCLAVHPYPHTALLKHVREGDGSADWLRRGNTAIMKDERDTASLQERSFTTQFTRAQCVPANVLLKALNVTHVDFFSLDIENVEEEVLRHFPFEEITVDVWAIEHRIKKL